MLIRQGGLFLADTMARLFVVGVFLGCSLTMLLWAAIPVWILAVVVSFLR